MLLADTRYFKRTTSEETGYYNKPKKDVERTMVSDSINDVHQVEQLDTAALPSFWSLVRRRRLGLLFICYPEISSRFTWGLPALWLLISFIRRGVKVTVTEIVDWLSGDLKKRMGKPDHSLRKVVFNEMGALPGDAKEMDALRRGR